MTCFSINQNKKILLIGLLASSLLFLQGCGSRKPITISSQPEGADIIADGKNIGKTPMQIDQDEVFPPRWHGSAYMVKGQLEMQKDGCDPVTMNVNDMVLSKDINKELKCRPSALATPEKPAPAVPAKPATSAPAAESSPLASTAGGPATTDEIEERLARLKQLRDRGVISAQEYAAQRKRILDSL